MNKRGIELSVNFIVMLILSIAIFAGGIYITSRFFSFAEKEKLQMDEQTNAEIEKLLDDGSRVAVPFNKKKTDNGGFVSFGIGVLNVLNVNPADFTVLVSFNKAYRKDNTEIIPKTSPNSWLRGALVEATPTGITMRESIPNNQQKTFLIGVEVEKAEQGIYIFDLDVHCFVLPDCANPYDSTHKLYVEVS